MEKGKRVATRVTRAPRRTAARGDRADAGGAEIAEEARATAREAGSRRSRGVRDEPAGRMGRGRILLQRPVAAAGCSRARGRRQARSMETPRGIKQALILIGPSKADGRMR